MRRLTRRTMLRGAGVSLALPWLESRPSGAGEESSAGPPYRAVFISNNLGVIPGPFFPTDTGPGYTLSPTLAPLGSCRDDFSVISGLSHPGVRGGHSTENCFLTAARGPTRSGFRNTISLDQFAADALGARTRFRTLSLGVNVDRANRSLSWTRDGALIPVEDKPSRIYQRLFVAGTPAEVADRRRRLAARGSVLDAVVDQTRALERAVGSADRQRLERFTTSIREVEERLHAEGAWQDRPLPVPHSPPPQDVTDKALVFRGYESMLAIASLALETDSTRLVTLLVDAFATPPFRLDEGGNEDTRLTLDDYHNLSHHGQAAERVAQLLEADRRQMTLLAAFLGALAERREGEQRLLDRTIVLCGSNMGDSNTHDNTNLPILLAGGGFRHAGHLAFDRDDNTPLSNLFVSLLQRLGVEADAFGSSTGTLTGI
ncbi:MAG: DUF1552 domain-containing protein [Planctomycetota bacterium]|nr:MAG: DUF1552 domain-containing protein [Planctomycetota bacterium]